MTHFRSNMTRGEFLDWLRYSAIAGGMPELFIERVDDLEDMLGLEKELDDLWEELAAAEKARDDLREELEGLIKAIEDSELEVIPKSIAAALKWANEALERHGGA